MIPAQSRAARGLLDWSQTELAKRSNLNESTIGDFENGRRVPTADTLAAIERTLEAAGVEFTNGAQPGVRMKATSLQLTPDEIALLNALVAGNGRQVIRGNFDHRRWDRLVAAGYAERRSLNMSDMLYSITEKARTYATADKAIPIGKLTAENDE